MSGTPVVMAGAGVGCAILTAVAPAARRTLGVAGTTRRRSRRPCSTERGGHTENPSRPDRDAAPARGPATAVGSGRTLVTHTAEGVAADEDFALPRVAGGSARHGPVSRCGP